MSVIAEPDQKRITQVVGYRKFSDCKGCDWRIRYYPVFKFYTEDEDMRKYNHSIIIDAKPMKHVEGMYEITIRPHNRHPGEPERVIFEGALRKEIREDYMHGKWLHDSPFHPEYSKCENCHGLGTVRDDDPEADGLGSRVKCGYCDGKRICTWAERKARCPKCQSLQIKTTQEAYGNSTDCPECGYHSYYSIGD
jgi:hypothetical protein